MRVFLVFAGAPFLAGLFPVIAAIPTISAIGSKFFDSNGNQFFIKGVVYQPGGSASLTDTLINTAQCALDAALMSDLGVNTISVYYAGSGDDHTGCMSAFEDAGIYVMVGLASPLTGINRASPAWTTSQLSSFAAVMDIFAHFDNTLGFFVGNEVVSDMTVSDVAPYVKAAALDLKSYRDSKGYRQIPVGYSGADDAALSPYLQNYLACGSNSIDFFGQNQYSWCDPSSFTTSGYNIIYANASGYPVPIFFSETGCNASPPRLFKDQAAVFGPQMNDEWSGAIIYEWSNEANDYGIASYGGSRASGTPNPKAPDFTNLQSQWATLNPTGTSIYDRKVSIPACPTFTSGGWLVHGDVKLSTLLQAVVVTSSSSGSKTTTGPTQGLPTLSSGTKGSTASPNTDTSDSRGPTSTGLSTGAKAGIAVGLIFIVVVIMLAAFLLWRRRRNLAPKAPLDLSPVGLEVGTPPTKHEHDNSSMSVQEVHPDASELASSTTFPAELGSSTLSKSHPAPGVLTAAELSTSPATPNVSSASQPKAFASAIPRHAAPASTTSSSWANAPWHSDGSPIDAEDGAQAKAQEVPVLSKNEEEDELRGIEAEESRIDAQIAESERIRALKEEKVALQAKKAELLAKRDGPSKT